jgi:hypothetical protein
MPKKKPDVMLENERHEQFARCVAQGNDVLVCYIGVGFNHDRNAAEMLAKSPDIRRRCDERFKIQKPHAHKRNGYRHPV